MQVLKVYFLYLFIFITWCYYVESFPVSSSNGSYPVAGTQIIRIAGPSIPEKSGVLNGSYNFQAAQQIFYIIKHENHEKPKGQNIPKLPSGYIFTSGIGAHKIYLNKMNWNEARKTCVKEGAHLAIIDSYKEDELLQQLRTQNNLDSVWLGLHDLFQEGDWTSVLNQPIGINGYINWSDLIKPNPDNFLGLQHCARLITKGMDDDICSVPFAFICEMPWVDSHNNETACSSDFKGDELQNVSIF